jgi:hypothetical protein
MICTRLPLGKLEHTAMLSRMKLVVGVTLIGCLLGLAGCSGSSSREAKIPTQTIDLPPEQQLKAAGGKTKTVITARPKVAD